jgi:membrane fusion protein (multidrug efflux system)
MGALSPFLNARQVRVAAALLAASLPGCNRVEPEVHAAPASRIHVQTIEAPARSVPSTIQVTGTLEAVLRTDLAANAAGRVLAVGVQRGQEVKRGTVVAQLDVHLSALQRDAARAQANVSNDQATSASEECARSARLAASGAIAPAELARQQWQCKIAQGSVAVAQLQAEVASKAVSDGVLAAPFDGWVVDRSVEPGEYVMPPTRVATLVSLDPLRLRISVPEAHLAALVTGATLAFHVAAYPDRSFAAKLAHVSPVVDPATRDVVADAEVSNTDKSLRPGMFVTAGIAVGERTTPAVPRSSLALGEGTAHLFVLRDGRIEERSVRPGADLDDEVSILDGLAVGERVVKSPGADVTNGAFAY